MSETRSLRCLRVLVAIGEGRLARVVPEIPVDMGISSPLYVRPYPKVVEGEVNLLTSGEEEGSPDFVSAAPNGDRGTATQQTITRLRLRVALDGFFYAGLDQPHRKGFCSANDVQLSCQQFSSQSAHGWRRPLIGPADRRRE